MTIGLLALAPREPFSSLDAAARAPWYDWIGGLFGTLDIVGTILLIRTSGSPSSLFSSSARCRCRSRDHFGGLGLPV